MNESELKLFENKYMLKLFLKRIIVISSVLKEYTQISDKEIVIKLQNSINLYLNELHKNKN